MEIERVVSGDLNKNIEQCVSLLMDVERKVASLKQELAQTLNTSGVQRTNPPLGYAPVFQSPVTGYPTLGPEAFAQRTMLPFAAFPQGVWQGPIAAPTSGLPTYGVSPYGAPLWNGAFLPMPLVHGPLAQVVPQGPIAQSPINQGTVPQTPIVQAPFVQSPYHTGLPHVGATLPYGVYGLPLNAPVQGFSPVPQGITPVPGVQNFGYIW